MSDAAIAAKHRPLQGALRSIEPGRIRGWAFAPEAPDEHLRIDVLVDGIVAGTTTASLHADRLAARGIGAGDHSFTYTAATELPVEARDRLEVRAYAANGQSLVLLPVRSSGPDSSIPFDFGFEAEDRTQRPVFVLGAARSGTSALGRALRMRTRYVGPGEGHLLDVLPKILRVTSLHYRNRWRDAVAGTPTLIALMPEPAMNAGLQHMFVQVARTLFPEGYWMDKTPGADMIRSVPVLCEMWPEARFVFLKRRPIENIESRRRKFPRYNFDDHCRLWADSMAAWEEVRDSVGDHGLVIEQLDLARRPEGEVRRLAAFLDLDAAEQAGLLESLLTDQPERTTSEFAPVYTLETVGWSESQQVTFKRICGEIMQRFDYGTGAQYSTVG
jgi:hypothetical protein